MLHRSLLISLLFFFSAGVSAQFPRFSLATDFGVQRSFKKEQRYWAVGQTVHLIFNFTPKQAAYAWASYYSDGEFTNTVIAEARSPSTLPQLQGYRNHAQMRFKQVSLGWRKYLRGSFDADSSWNLYAYGGFGLILGRVINSSDPFIDTSLYNVTVRPGKANFKRLTVDLGLGVEFPLGADIFLYVDGRTWIPTTDYPSRYLFVNRKAPVTGMVDIGIRFLFD